MRLDHVCGGGEEVRRVHLLRVGGPVLHLRCKSIAATEGFMLALLLLLFLVRLFAHISYGLHRDGLTVLKVTCLDIS